MFESLDFALYNAPAFAFCKLSRTKGSWAELEPDERLLYEDLIKDRKACAVLCRHNVGPEHERPINTYLNTRHDILACEIMVQDSSGFSFCRCGTNAEWEDFVFGWMEQGGPERIMKSIIEAGVLPANVVPTALNCGCK